MKAKDLKSAILFGNIKSNAILSLVDRKNNRFCSLLAAGDVAGKWVLSNLRQIVAKFAYILLP